ncbi:MAG: phospholipid carrier-dependent glycosyltransferase [Vulcanimicrobiaceae bacterium]
MRSAALAGERPEQKQASAPYALFGVLVAAFAVRMLFVGAGGFGSDVSTFESWTLTLADHALRDFYASAGFADYPPGYFLILAAVGHLYRELVHADPSYGILKIFVKLPGIVADLACAGIVYALVGRFASRLWALGAAAFFAFDPATIFISAYWGQVDSVAAAFALGALLLTVDSARPETARATGLLAAAWLLVAYSILIKPPAIVLVPVLLAFTFATDDAAVRARRLWGTGLGIVASFVLAYALALVFHAGANPFFQYGWLYDRYAYASNVYAYNSVNAFNLYVMVIHRFWEPDSTLVPNLVIGGHTYGLPEYVWGIGLFVAAILLVVSRAVQRRDAIAPLEAAMLLGLAYFLLLTRMHERYIFDALAFCIPLIFYRRRYLYAAIVLSLTLLANLFYSLDYLHVMEVHLEGAGVDATNLMPLVSRPAAWLNVATFFYLGYAFLGSGEDALEKFNPAEALARIGATARAWFSPREGTVAMTVRDWWAAFGWSVLSFLICWYGYAYPVTKYFDEIYYARAGEEYLKHKDIFEFTHPPLTKLVITASMWLFGGLHGAGDTSQGWRFLNVVVGALVVLLTYAFAKRLLGSSGFASVAAALMTFDGFHFVQSRIATPEITVCLTCLLTLYAAYRFTLASQVRVAPLLERRSLQRVALAALGGAVVAALGSLLIARGQDFAAHAVTFVYLFLGAYALARLLAPRADGEKTVSYADGSRIERGTFLLADGGTLGLRGGTLQTGDATVADGGALVHRAEGLQARYARDGSLRYASDDGEGTFTTDGRFAVDGRAAGDGRRDWILWLVLLGLAAGTAGAAKWNGLFDFILVFFVVAVVVSQRWWAPVLRALGVAGARRAPALWGNPFGFSPDLVVAVVLFLGATVYWLSYLPYFALGHSLADLIELQRQMYIYHAVTVAHDTHPYSSKWWQWPILEIPITYYYTALGEYAKTHVNSACCVSEIVALPNPLMWWTGLIAVPFMGWIAWRERHKGYALLFIAYFFQWLPWMISPRIDFEYNFIPNLPIIVLADALLCQRLWRLGARLGSGTTSWPRVVVGAWLIAVVGAFVFWYPVLAGTPITYDAWNARMLTGLEGNNWINPHPGH